MSNHRLTARIAAVAAVAGAIAQVVATLLEPERPNDPVAAIQVVAGNGIWTFDRLLDFIGLLLAVGALAVVGRAFATRPARAWADLGQPFLGLFAALGAGAVVTGATLKDIAVAWTAAGQQDKPAQLAAFAATSNLTDALFFGAFLAMGVYLGTLGAAVLAGGVHARWVGWATAASATLILFGDLLVLAADAAFLAVLAGFIVFMVVLVAMGVSLWRQDGLDRPQGEFGPEGAVEPG
jgi:hypothetical protein